MEFQKQVLDSINGIHTRLEKIEDQMQRLLFRMHMVDYAKIDKVVDIAMAAPEPQFPVVPAFPFPAGEYSAVDKTLRFDIFDEEDHPANRPISDAHEKQPNSREKTDGDDDKKELERQIWNGETDIKPAWYDDPTKTAQYEAVDKSTQTDGALDNVKEKLETVVEEKGNIGCEEWAANDGVMEVQEGFRETDETRDKMLLGIKDQFNCVKMFLIANDTPAHVLTMRYCWLTQRPSESTWFSLDGEAEFESFAQVREGDTIFVHDFGRGALKGFG